MRRCFRGAPSAVHVALQGLHSDHSTAVQSNGVGAAVGRAVGDAVGVGVGAAVGYAVGMALHTVRPAWPLVHVPEAQSSHTE
jgi:hypothetical protein